MLAVGCGLLFSCAKKDLFKGEKKPGKKDPAVDTVADVPRYLYPFAQEPAGVEAEITITLESDATALGDLALSVPPLKYNKSLLFMLTQDDCKQSAFSTTWAAINGKPLDISDPKRRYYYDIENLEAADLPPNVFALGKTLGSTDGSGHEVRFHFTTTLAPEWSFMNEKASVNPGFTENYYRFYMKGGLRWNNVRELLNFGNGIAFHDVNTAHVNQVDSLLSHFAMAQQITQKALNGRAIKVLAEPNGNKTYLQAARLFTDIQSMTAQSGAQKLVPDQVTTDLNQVTLSRVFVNNVAEVKNLVYAAFAQEKTQREAVHIGVHETDKEWAQLLLWLNDTYGKDGQDVLWFPSQEEYYEYNYNRKYSQLTITPDGKEIKIRVKFPNQKNFYFPALTLNIAGLKLGKIKSVTSNDAVSGLSYGAYADGVALHVDCRKFLYNHAEYYVKRYQAKKTESNLADARYHVNALKNSDKRTLLLKELP